MKAIGFYNNLPIEDPKSLEVVEIEKPSPKGREILVQVQGLSINPADVFGRKEAPIANAPKITGTDASGIIVEVGESVELFQIGDEVYYAGDITKQGSSSEFHIVDERIVGRKPQNLSFAEAAAIPLTGLTAYEGIFERLHISHNPEENKGKTMLIVGVGGGVGSISVQVAKKAGLTVIGTASRPETIAWAKSLGADHVITHYEAFLPQLNHLGIGMVDYIMCLNSTSKHFDNMVEAIKPQGLICGVAAAEEPVNLFGLGLKSAGFVWEMMFTRSMFQTDDMIHQHYALNQLSEWLETGDIKTTAREIMNPINVDNLKKAHALVESGKMIGKVALENFEI